MNEEIELNEHHRRRLLVSCEYVDRLLADMESVIATDASLSPFPKYVQDLDAQERQLMREQITELRSQLVSFLKGRNVPIPGPAISARHSILTSLGYIDIAVEELKARYLRGYGPVPHSLVADLDKSVEEVQATVRASVSSLKKAMRSKETNPEEGTS